MKQTQKGSTALVAVIIVVVAISAGTMGWILGKSSKISIKEEMSNSNTASIVQEQRQNRESSSDNSNETEVENEDIAAGEILGWSKFTSEGKNFRISFDYPLEYPTGKKIFIEEDWDNEVFDNIGVYNFNCFGPNDIKCGQDKSDFSVQIYNSETVLTSTGKVFSRSNFDEDKGIVKYGPNDFYHGIQYGGPQTADTYLLIEKNIGFDFYGNFNQDLVAGILASAKIEYLK